MSNREIKLYIADIITAADKIQEYTKDLDFAQFAKDSKTIDAVIRNLSVIGEAVKNIPDTIKEKHPNIPWNEIMGMRNKVIHEYFGVDEEILWKTIHDDLPVFKDDILELAKKFDQAK